MDFYYFYKTSGPQDDYEWDHRDDPSLTQFGDPNLQAEHDERYPQTPSELKWLVTPFPEHEVLLEDPSNPVPNHAALLVQHKGRDYVRQQMASPTPVPLGLQGVYRDGGLQVGGYLMSDSSVPGRAYDPAQSWAGHQRVRSAVRRVRDELQARGYPLGETYNIPRIRPGQGITMIPRTFSALQGAFVDLGNGERIQFTEIDHIPGDKAAGVGERWELQGSNGQVYILLDDGTIEDSDGHAVGRFDPYTSGVKLAASFEYALPPLGLHMRTDKAMIGAGLTASVTYPPGIVAEYPDGFSGPIPGTGLDSSFITSDYEIEHGKSIEGVPVNVETSDDPTLVVAVFDALGGRDVDISGLPDQLRSTLEALMRKRGSMKTAEQISDLYTDEEKKALECPNCGSHTLRAYNVQQGEAEMKCLTCGKTFQRPVFKNPEASTKEADGTGLGPSYPVDPQLQAQIIGLMQQIAQATDATQKQQLQQQLEQLLGGNPNMQMQQPQMQQQPIAGLEILETPPDWFMIRLNEELTNEILRESGMLKGAPYPENSYKNAPDHTPKGQKKWPKEVNAIYNACMREGNGRGDSKDEKESSCAAIAWAQYKKSQSHVAADKHTPGTRVEVQHQTNKGLKGSIVKHRGTDSATSEDTYDVQLDNGEKLEGLRDSDLKRIKSATVVDNSNLTDTTDKHFLESMTFTADFEDEHLAPDMYDDGPEFDDDPVTNPACPQCGGDGQPMGRLGRLEWYRCRNCGWEFNSDDVAGESDEDYWRNREMGQGDLPPDEDPFTIWPGRHPMGAAKEADGWPKSDQPKHPNGLPDVPKFDGNKTKFPYDPPAQDSPYDEPDLSGGDVECPNCHSNAKSMGEFNAREYYRCSNGDCQMEFSVPNSDESEKWAPDDPDQLFGQDKPDYTGAVALSAVDETGQDLKAGDWYIVHGQSYKVPDVVKIVSIGDDGITAHFETDNDGQFPFKVSPDEYGHYSFKPYQRSHDPAEVDEQAQKSASGWSVEARRNFSQKEQIDLIEENMDGRARNFDKLDLSGTHYETRETAFIDADFLWGM